jgi:hypothetical protein
MLAADTTPQLPNLPAPIPVVVVEQAPPAHEVTAKTVLWTILGVGLMFGAAAIHGQWAYEDWTCAFKSCVAVAPVRRRRWKK